jgi:microcystin-dependent protein
MDAWLTPDTPASGFICRRLLIPNSVNFLAIVKGALLPLTHDYNFEQFGTLTPAQTAEYFQAMFADFSLAVERTCRMIGEIIPFAGSASPDPAWLVCDGTSVLRADYPDLFALIGTTYGSADSTHFNLPDLQGRTVLGVGTGTGLSTYALGDTGGEETHTLVSAEMPSHTHSITVPGLPLPFAPAAVPADAPPALPSISGSAGGDGAHNNLQPFIALTYLIVAL